jgi:anti-anti-sigma regulatory factor
MPKAEFFLEASESDCRILVEGPLLDRASDELVEFATECLGRRPAALVMDFLHVDALDSRAMGRLAHLRRRLAAQACTLAVENVAPPLFAHLEQAGLVAILRASRREGTTPIPMDDMTRSGIQAIPGDF